MSDAPDKVTTCLTRLHHDSSCKLMSTSRQSWLNRASERLLKLWRKASPPARSHGVPPLDSHGNAPRQLRYDFQNRFSVNSGCVMLLVLAALLARGAASAQTTNATLYRLNPDGSFEQGCFPPCLCPVMIDAPVRGTFLLTPTGFDGLFNTYAVSDVNWIVWIEGTARVVTGSGAYRVGGEFAVQQQLSLYLQMDGGKVEHFDSGLVTSSTPFPDIKVTISTNGQYCFDTVFNVSASPVPLNQVCPYGLLSSSTFQRGCFGACDCAVGPLEPIVGTFSLVPLERAPGSNEFAVVDVRWQVLEASNTIAVSGFGIYDLVGQSNVQQQLRLVLTVDGEAPTNFNSGLVSGGDEFPLMDVLTSVSGMVCFDTVITISAAPAVPPLHLDLTDADTIALTWVIPPGPCFLQESSDLMNWTTVTNQPTAMGQENQVILARTPGSRFFRLQSSGN